MKTWKFLLLISSMSLLSMPLLANTNPASATSELFTLDVKKPAVAILSPTPGQQVLNTSLMNVTWTASDDNLASNPISISLIIVPNETHPLLDNTNNSGNSQVSLPNIVSDRAIVRVSAIDQYGNVGYAETPGYISLIDSTIDVEEIVLSDNKFRAFPNPANNFIWVEFLNNKQQAVRLEMLDIMGQVVAHKTIDQTGLIRTGFAVEGLSHGLYLIRLETVDGYAVNKILIR